MTHSPDLPIVTPRLRLRAFTCEDVDAVHAYRRLPEVARYLVDGPLSRETCVMAVQMRVHQTRLDEPEDRLVLAVERKADARMIGELVLILHDLTSGQGELGYVLGPDWQGRGYATEAAAALLAWAFEDFGFHRVHARCDAANIPSWRLMERLGMRREAHFRDHALIKGRWQEELVYAILAREWFAGRAGALTQRNDVPGQVA